MTIHRAVVEFFQPFSMHPLQGGTAATAYSRRPRISVSPTTFWWRIEVLAVVARIYAKTNPAPISLREPTDGGLFAHRPETRAGSDVSIPPMW